MARYIDWSDADGPIIDVPNKMQHPSSKNDIVAAQYEAYLHGNNGKGMSLRQISILYYGRYTKQSIYDSFKRRGYPLRPLKFNDAIVVDGIKFTLDSRCLYWRSTSRSKDLYLHRYIWEKHN